MRRWVGLALLAVIVAATLPRALAATPPAGTPWFVSYTAPGRMGSDAGEPSIGVDPETQAVFFQAGLDTLRVTGFGAGGTAQWADVTPLTSMTTLDPILRVDPKTGRLFVSQLTGACSLMSYSDDAGKSWAPSSGCAPASLLDHQSVGVGPFVRGGALRPVTAYPNAVYYCSHDGARASCGTSLDGGRTFTPANVAYTLTSCSTNFGHIKAAPDGTVYLPPRGCGGSAGVAVSENNGLTWRVSKVPDSYFGNAGHPAVATASDGTAYLAWGGSERSDGGGAPYIAVTRDRARTWTSPRRLGGELGIRNTKFVTTIAGDGPRAAVAFLGSTTGGDDQADNFPGSWHLYVSYTYNRGATWTTVNATPHNPVQVGTICISGTTCLGRTRNLLDFNDVVIDRYGRVLAAIADGCLAAACDTRDRATKAVIVRQGGGRGLIGAYDRQLLAARRSTRR